MLPVLPVLEVKTRRRVLPILPVLWVKQGVTRRRVVPGLHVRRGITRRVVTSFFGRIPSAESPRCPFCSFPFHCPALLFLLFSVHRSERFRPVFKAFPVLS